MTAPEKTDSQIDSQKLVADRLSLSSVVPQVKTVEPDEVIATKGESLDLTALVPTCPIPVNGVSSRFETCSAHHSFVLQHLRRSVTQYDGQRRQPNIHWLFFTFWHDSDCASR
jgi:hypothetical protein